MKKGLSLKLLALALVIAMPVMAAVVNVTWTKATTNVDGSAIPATGAGSVTTTVEYGTCNGAAFGTKIADVVTATAGVAADSPNLAPGTYCFRAFHTNTFGVNSDPSAVGVKVIGPPKPNPPTITGIN